MATGRLGSSTSITGTVRQQTRSVIAAQNFAPKPNVSLSEISDVSTAGVENGDALIFNSATNRFEANIIAFESNRIGLSMRVTIGLNCPLVTQFSEKNQCFGS